jgi:hypothetical protein
MQPSTPHPVASILPSAPHPFASAHPSTLHPSFPPLHRYAYDWAHIRAELLPTKTEQQLFHRKKNRVAGNAPDNCVKDVVRKITQPLKPDEITLLHRLLDL